MWDLLIDFLELLGIVGLRKKKKREAELASLEINDSAPEQEISKEARQDGVSVCAGCNRKLDLGANYELDKAWCSECYKTHFLKVKG